MIKKFKNKEEAQIEFERKSHLFYEAIRARKELNDLYQDSSLEGINELDDRYWSGVFHKRKPNFHLDKDSELTLLLEATVAYSVIFICDTESEETVTISLEENDNYRNICLFARFYEEPKCLVAQFTDRLVIYKLNSELAQLGVLDSEAQKCDSRDFNEVFTSAKFTSDGKYLALSEGDGKICPVLVKLDWDKSEMEVRKLIGHARIWHINSLAVLETEFHPIVVLGITASKTPDPDSGYTVYVGNGKRMWGYQTIIFDHNTPRKFELGRVQENGWFELKVFGREDVLLSVTSVPSNLDLFRDKEK